MTVPNQQFSMCENVEQLRINIQENGCGSKFYIVKDRLKNVSVVKN